MKGEVLDEIIPRTNHPMRWWARIDGSLIHNRRVRHLSSNAQAVFALAWSFCASIQSDGAISEDEALDLIDHLGRDAGAIPELLDAGLWQRMGRGYFIPMFAAMNNQEDLSRKRSEAGRIGGLKSGETRRAKAASSEANEAIASFASSNEANELRDETLQDERSATAAVIARARGDGGGKSDPRILKALGALRLGSSHYDAIARIASEFPTDTEANRPLSPEGEAEACWSWYHSGAYSRDLAKVNWVTAYRNWMRRAAHPGGSDVKPVPLRGGGKREKPGFQAGPDDYAALERLERKHAERLAAEGERDATAR